MAFEASGLNVTLEASADLSADQYKGVILGASGIAVAGADVKIVGVLQGNPDAADQAATVRFAGVTKAILGATVARGVTVFTDANGRFTGTGTNFPAGITLQGADNLETVALLLL